MSNDNPNGRTLTLDAFKQRLTIIVNGEADRLRGDYITRFVNRTSDTFQILIARPGPQGDETSYTAYLWDTLNHPTLISEAELLARLRQWDDVYVFWDLHNSRKILVPGYWKFPLDAVLFMPAAVLLDALDHDLHVSADEEFLPEDIYIFEREMKSSLILTHEIFDGDQRICAEAD